MGRRVRIGAGLLALAEIVVFVLVAGWIGVGWTLLATLATSALGWVLLARQGTRALTELRDRARERRAPGRALGDAGLIGLGGLLMVLPGFLGDVVGLLCLLPPTRFLVRGLLARVLAGRLPAELRGPVHVRSRRAEGVPPAGPPRPGAPLVIEGEVVRDEPARDDAAGR
ncbi:FxsA family protein [Geodermatophilus sabuli]|uniref:UPF0716 protein FxsA n=1 Tax=Geodermatophilus sabuli TaxID=1564158 RepID=A0A285EBF4_9ACTN|nr:FxsA family protein [Geodermatophilus sabuli]MBB3084291.1 UPF0716 protein FxsA [Geodermatophilus sabuli]SNX96439.1 UPF0716 protein FxsA [Geodermatophilus sabuli]